MMSRWEAFVRMLQTLALNKDPGARTAALQDAQAISWNGAVRG